MHGEILTAEQITLLPLVRRFLKKFGLVGGTAIALQIGHRRSVDFDLFTDQKFGNASIRNILTTVAPLDSVVRDEHGQYTVVLNGVRFTFFQYPYPVSYSKSYQNYLRLPDLLTLAAMKAHALGRRAKWKDYVDLYFVTKSHYSIGQIIRRAKKIFQKEFNEKIFRVQLAYFDDIDYSEKVIFMKGFETKDSVIKKELERMSLISA